MWHLSAVLKSSLSAAVLHDHVLIEVVSPGLVTVLDLLQHLPHELDDCVLTAEYLDRLAVSVVIAAY